MILNFNLSQVASLIVQVVALFDPEPPFQYTQDNLGNLNIALPNQLVRDNTVASAGFPASADALANSPTLGIIPLPANSYVINFPSFVYGAAAPNDTSYSVIQINSVVAKIEPGFSRVRIDYLDSNGNPAGPEYFDCPFYEGWDVTARELNNIVNYVEGAVNFLQQEINVIDDELSFLDSRLFLRGITVSGKLQWTPTTEGLISGPLNREQFSHSMPDSMAHNLSLPKSMLIFPPPGQPNPIRATDPNEMLAAVNSAALGSLARVNNGNYIYGYFDDSSDYKGSFLMSENTDGTITFMFYDANLYDGGTSGKVYWQVVFNLYGENGVLIDSSISPDYALQDIQFYGNYNGSGTTSFTLQPAKTGQDSPGDGFDPSTQPVNTSLYSQINLYNTNSNKNGTVFVCVLRPVASPGTSIERPTLWWSVAGGSNAGNYLSTPGVCYNSSNSTTSYLILKGASGNNGTGGATITSLSESEACAGGNVPIHISGSGFNPTYSIYIGSTAYPATNYSINSASDAAFTVPSNVPAGTYPIILKNSQYTVTSSQSLMVLSSPVISGILDTTSNQTGQGAIGENIQLNGSGFASETSLYLVSNQTIVLTPTSISDSQVNFEIPNGTAPGNYNVVIGTPCGTDSIPFTVVSRVPVGPPPQLVLQPNTVNMTDGQEQQFFAYVILQNYQPRDVSQSSTWEVNNIVGGDATDGTVTQQGLYSVPVPIISPATVTVSATYTYEGTQPGDPYDGTILTATATVNLAPAAQINSPYSSVSVLSQINIFLGDGRMGYVPTGSTITMYPAQYLYVQFDESLNPANKEPVISPNDVQLLQLKTKNALDSDIANAIYNLGDYTLDPTTGLILTHRTVVLGIIDPTDGLWHSMWDIGLPPNPAAPMDSISNPDSKSLPAYYASNLPAFSDNSKFKGSLMEYIDDITGIHQTDVINLHKRVNLLLTGHCTFTQDEFEILDQIVILGNLDDKYGTMGIIPAQKIKVEKGEILFINPEYQLKVAHIGNKNDELVNPKSIIIGVALDKFYTKWPILGD